MDPANGSEASDADLVRAFQRGDQDAYAAFVRRHQDRLFRLASVWLFDASEAADAVQEVFTRALDGLRRFRFGAAPFTWLYSTCRRVCHELNRRRAGEPLPDGLAAAGPGPADAAGSAEAAREIRKLVAGLPPRQQEVVVLRVFEELSVRETARALRIREGTVKASLHKALQSLRARAGER